MAYDENKPAAADKLSASQLDILNNFTAIKTAFEINHEDFNAGGQGKHIHVTLPQQTVGGTFPPITSATECGMYCKTDGTSPAVYFRKPGQMVGDTTNDISLSTPITGSSVGTTLMNGLIIKWGSAVMATGSYNKTIVFADAFSTGALFTQLTPTATSFTGAAKDHVIIVKNLTTAGFSVIRHPSDITATFSFYYLAVGY